MGICCWGEGGSPQVDLIQVQVQVQVHILSPIGRPALYYTQPFARRFVMLYTSGSESRPPITSPYTYIYNALILVLLFTRCLWELVLARENHWPSVKLREGLGGNGGAICTDSGTDGHKEASDYSVSNALSLNGQTEWLTRRWLLSRACTVPAFEAYRWVQVRSARCW